MIISGGDLIKKYLTININNKNTEIMVIRKSRKNYYISYCINYEKGIEDTEIKDGNQYVDEVTKIIKDNINIKFKKVYFNIQNDEIIIRNIDNIKSKKHKEIIQLIKYEINRYIPLDLQKYIIKYKKIMDFQGKKLIQGILFPKKCVYICEEISESLKIKKKYLYVNFDILQKLIDDKLINFSSSNNKKTIVIENRKEDMIINTLFHNKIIESYIVNKNNSPNFLSDYGDKDIYYFGISDDYIKSLNIKKIYIKDKLSVYDTEESVDKTLDYLCSWGMII